MPLGEQHHLLRESVRKFARERLAPNAPQWDREKRFPREEVAALGAMGLFGVAIPEEWGGAAMDVTACAIACEEISAGDGATCTIVMVTNLVANILFGYGNDAQKKEFLVPIAHGKALGALQIFYTGRPPGKGDDILMCEDKNPNAAGVLALSGGRAKPLTDLVAAIKEGKVGALLALGSQIGNASDAAALKEVKSFVAISTHEGPIAAAGAVSAAVITARHRLGFIHG